MLLTEEEAKQKWCPMSRTLAFGADYARQGDDPTIVGASVNRDVGAYDEKGDETVHIAGRHRCIASGCMAWRWHEVKWDGIPANHRGPQQERVGFCGAFGRPQT